MLVLQNRTTTGSDPDRADKIVWKWLRGPASSFEQLGDPIGNVTSYSLCVYDEVSGTPSLVMSAGVPAGGICRNGNPCWKQLGSTSNPRGYRYLDRDLDPDGILRIVLKAGDAGKSKVTVKGKGANLGVPGPASPGGFYLNQDTNVTVQLIKSDGGVCWESIFSPPAVKNQSRLFPARHVFRDKCGAKGESACS